MTERMAMSFHQIEYQVTFIGALIDPQGRVKPKLFKQHRECSVYMLDWGPRFRSGASLFMDADPLRGSCLLGRLLG